MNKANLLALMLSLSTTAASWAQVTPASQMERLDRGLVVIPSGNTRTLSWRLLGTDNENTTRFTILRDGEPIAENKYETFYKDNTAGKSYQVVTLVDGIPIDTTAAVAPWAKNYLSLKLQRPAAGRTKPYTTTIDKETVSFPNGQDYTYSPNDCSVGDVDGFQGVAQDSSDFVAITDVIPDVILEILTLPSRYVTDGDPERLKIYAKERLLIHIWTKNKQL